MSMTLNEFDSYSKLQEKLETAVKGASARLLSVVRSMECVGLTTGTHQVKARFTQDGLVASISPDVLEKAVVRLDDNVILVPEDTMLALRVAFLGPYARTSSDAILTGLRSAHRNKRQVIAVLQPYIDQLESLEEWTVHSDTVNRREKQERDNDLLFGEFNKGDTFFPALDVPWDDPIYNSPAGLGREEE